MRALVFVVLVGVALEAAVAGQKPDDRASERTRMVEEQLAGRDIRDEQTLRAMRTVPRHLFVPEPLRRRAYDDSPLPIGYGQTISQPYIVAFMTAIARLTPESKVLEIGTGSGYQAAVAAEISRNVCSLEIVPGLAQRAEATLKVAGYERVKVRNADGYHGWPDEAPFDVIIVTAAAETIPPPLIAQLKEGGRMLIPVGPQFSAQNLVLVTKRGGRVRTKTLMPVAFVPFTRTRE